MTNSAVPELRRVRLAEVRAEGRLRPVSEAGVAAILASVAEVGRIKDPIHVRQIRGRQGAGLVLLAGAHRLAAYARLGIEEAEAWVWTGIGDDQARLIEIDDNLAGAELTALDTAVFLAERKRAYERLHPETRRGGDRRSALALDQTELGSVRSFAVVTAEKFGLTERQVYKVLAAGARLTSADADRLRAAPRPVTLKDLTVIARLGEPEAREGVIAALAGGAARSAAEALRRARAAAAGEVLPPRPSRHETEFVALSRAWAQAGTRARRRFAEAVRADLVRLFAEAEAEGGAGDREGDGEGEP